MDKPKRGRPKKMKPEGQLIKHKVPHMYTRRFVEGKSKAEALSEYSGREPNWRVQFEKSVYMSDDKKERARVKKAYYRADKKKAPEKPPKPRWRTAKKADGTSYKNKDTYERAMKKKETDKKKREKRTKK